MNRKMAIKKVMHLFLVISAFFFSGPVFAGGVSSVIDGSGTWTNIWYVEKGARLNVSIGNCSSDADLTITLQRRLPGDSNWGRDVDSWNMTGTSEDKEYITAHPEPEGCWYRIGCDEADDYTSGSCTCRIGGGRK